MAALTGSLRLSAEAASLSGDCQWYASATSTVVVLSVAVALLVVLSVAVFIILVLLQLLVACI